MFIFSHLSNCQITKIIIELYLTQLSFYKQSPICILCCKRYNFFFEKILLHIPLVTPWESLNHPFYLVSTPICSKVIYNTGKIGSHKVKCGVHLDFASLLSPSLLFIPSPLDFGSVLSPQQHQHPIA